MSLARRMVTTAVLFAPLACGGGGSPGGMPGTSAAGAPGAAGASPSAGAPARPEPLARRQWRSRSG